MAKGIYLKKIRQRNLPAHFSPQKFLGQFSEKSTQTEKCNVSYPTFNFFHRVESTALKKLLDEKDFISEFFLNEFFFRSDFYKL